MIATAEDPAFVTFWGTYPRRIGKGAARKAFATALKKTDAQTVFSAIEAQQRAGMFALWAGYTPPHPSTWLNQERWDDEIVPRTAPAFRNGALDALARDYALSDHVALEGPAGD